MTKILQAESTLTDRYQTTVPEIVRKALGLHKRDKIAYVINANGTVTITRGETSEEDPILAKFLDFLAKDIEQNPPFLRLNFAHRKTENKKRSPLQHPKSTIKFVSTY